MEEIDEKFDLVKCVMEEIDETTKPLELVSYYIVWKNGGEMSENDLAKELDAFVQYLTPRMLEQMIDKIAEAGLINKDKDGYFSLKNRETSI